MITPNTLQKGDTIAIVSTARKLKKKELQPALKILESWGLKAVLGKTIGAEENQFAGNEKLRAEDFQQMLDNPYIKAIWCARGGYGTVKMIDMLDFSAFQKNPKWIIGYSDVTVLHSYIHNLGIETLHAQMCLDIENKTEAARESIRKVLFEQEYSIAFNVNTYNKTFQQKQQLSSIQGKIVGGNLSVLYSLCGSNSAINTDGKILFIEDLDEYLYHIDRMMMNLKRNGMLANLKALIIGGMTDMHDNAIPFGKNAEEIILEAVKDYNFPVYFNFPAGHIKDNQAMIFGREVKLNSENDKVILNF
ncbi:S66 peptidase family protein [Aequorivita xiaoshiensis]|uniref:LD-carboxypeptidase n=1 Tax=Aequorivita xiaoshiensis TaxID=2874476 RepID=A0A9X1R189_9FLAO|nr:LD-carboxypeptidase [Aequorivita xiaoshiensis]MCG2430082.1 LD-carboxypeptidase [Aequorivita xiaoshiensis]